MRTVLLLIVYYSEYFTSIFLLVPSVLTPDEPKLQA